MSKSNAKWRVGADCEQRGQKANEHEQNANEEVTMATSHGSTPLAPVTLMSQWRIKGKVLTRSQNTDQEVGGWGKQKAKYQPR